MAKQQPERRQYKRIKKHFILTYFDLAYPQIRHEASQLKNISLGGMCLITSRPFPNNTSLGIELKTPFLSELTHLEGVVLGSQEKVKDIIYETRLQFTSLDHQAEFILNKMIQYFEKRTTNMNKIQIGLIGYGNVGSGVAAFLQKYRTSIRQKAHTDIILRGVCDRSIAQKKTEHLGKIVLTDKAQDILTLPDVDVIVELIGGVKAAKEIVVQALKSGKHVVTANKELIANDGPELFALARQNNCNIYYESSVMAGVPVIRMITEGIAGNQVNGLYGIINGTCNFILSQMTRDKVSFEQALLEAQQKGFAESDPTLDINGMDSANKLGILVLLTMGKHIHPKDIYTEGITHISHDDIEHAESLGLVIKLLAIAKKHEQEIEIRVHPTLFTQDHPLASINGVLNAIFINTTPLGSILLSGKGAGQMPAASGIVSDLIHLASRQQAPAEKMLANLAQDDPGLTIKKMDDVLTRFYLRFMTTDKPGVLANITGILGNHGISINSVSQKAHNKIASVPVIMLTDYAPEKDVRQALKEIQQLPVVKAKPVAIRMENLT